jgi:hypothetical protein
VVEHSTHYPKIKGLNPTISTGKDKCQKKFLKFFSTVVEHSTLNLKIKGSNPATSTGKERWQLKFFSEMNPETSKFDQKQKIRHIPSMQAVSHS